MATPAQIKVIRASLKELERIYDQICNIYDQLRVKALALIAGEVAIVSFIFGSSNKLNVPIAPDRRIFFFSAVVALITAFGLLLWIVSTVIWKVPHDLDGSTRLLKKHPTEDDYLEELHDEYIKVIEHNKSVAGPKLKRFNWTIYLLSFGVIILLVIKYGGPTQ